MPKPDAVELSFTDAIVGPPMSVSLGRRLRAPEYPREGIHIDMHTAACELSRGWTEWWMLRTGDEWFTSVQRRPGRLRLWIERHALLLGMLALTLLAAELVWFLVWRGV